MDKPYPWGQQLKTAHWKSAARRKSKCNFLRLLTNDLISCPNTHPSDDGGRGRREGLLIGKFITN